MVYSAEIFSVNKENSPVIEELMEDLNYNEIEIKVCELKLERAIIYHYECKEVLTQVEHYQNQFLIQKGNINLIKEKLQRIKTLVEHMNLSRKWYNSKIGRYVLEEIESFQECFNELLYEFEGFTKFWLPT